MTPSLGARGPGGTLPESTTWAASISSSYERHLERRSMPTSEESRRQGCDAATPRWTFTQTAKTSGSGGTPHRRRAPPREHRPLQKHVPGRIPRLIAERRSARLGLAEVVINCERKPIINEHTLVSLGSAELTSYAEPPMDTFVVSLNVELFRRLLERETDEPRRQALVRLLAQEEAKLVELDGKLCT
jgi:hypothetical protein